MYSPKIDEKLVPCLYHTAQARREPQRTGRKAADKTETTKGIMR